MPLLTLPSVARGIISLAFFYTLSAAWAETVEVPVGQAVSLKLDDRADTVAVGNAAIADARIVFGDTILLVGKEPGTTNLLVFDERGDEFFSSSVTVPLAVDRRNITFLEGSDDGVRSRVVTCSSAGCTEQKDPEALQQEQETTVTTEETVQTRESPDGTITREFERRSRTR